MDTIVFKIKKTLQFLETFLWGEQDSNFNFETRIFPAFFTIFNQLCHDVAMKIKLSIFKHFSNKKNDYNLFKMNTIIHFLGDKVKNKYVKFGIYSFFKK
jgi:hypothetical protein